MGIKCPMGCHAVAFMRFASEHVSLRVLGQRLASLLNSLFMLLCLLFSLFMYDASMAVTCLTN